MKGNAGFTLIELMIVIAIIAIINPFLLPDLEAARRGANEVGAANNLKHLPSAQELFKLDDLEGDGEDYAVSLRELGEFSYIDSTLASGENHGYHFRMTRFEPSTSWRAIAVPAEPCRTGARSFMIDQTSELQLTEVLDCAGFVAEDRTEKTISQIDQVTKEDTVGGIKDLVGNNPGLIELLLIAIDANQNGQISFDEALSINHLDVARGIKDNLNFGQDWDTLEIGKDKWLDHAMDKLYKHIGKMLNLGVANELSPPEVKIEDILPSPLPSPPSQLPPDQLPPQN